MNPIDSECEFFKQVTEGLQKFFEVILRKFFDIQYRAIVYI